MKNRLLALGLVLLSGCASITAGLHFDEQKARARAAASDNPNVGLFVITPELLVQLAAEARQRMAALPTDPLASQLARYEYRIAPYDVLSVIVWEHPELTIPAGEFRAAEAVGNVVSADGTIFYPHVGVVKVAGMTLPEVRTLLTERLRKFVENPQLDVRIAGFRGQHVNVTGEVTTPGTLPINDVPLRVADAISLARGFTPEAFPPDVTLTREGKVYRLDLSALFDRGDVSQNWLLRDGDILNVPSRGQNKVFVMGEVRQPSSRVMVRGHMTLAEALGDAQGLDPVTANAGAVYVFRGRYDAPRIYRLDATYADALLLATQFQLEPLDVIYVDTYGLATWNRMVSQILPTISGIWQAATTGYYFQLIGNQP